MTTQYNPAANLSRDARKKGGQMSGGNFKNNPQRAAEAGRKGGKASRRRSESSDKE